MAHATHAYQEPGRLSFGQARRTHLLPSEAPPEDSPFAAIERLELREAIAAVLCTLRPRQEKVIRMRFGLDGEGEKTYETVAQAFAVTKERIRQIEARAIRELRHPNRSRRLKEFVPPPSRAELEQIKKLDEQATEPPPPQTSQDELHPVILQVLEEQRALRQQERLERHLEDIDNSRPASVFLPVPKTSLQHRIVNWLQLVGPVELDELAELIARRFGDNAGQARSYIVWLVADGLLEMGQSLKVSLPPRLSHVANCALLNSHAGGTRYDRNPNPRGGTRDGER